MRAVFLPRTQEGDSTLPENNPKCNDCFLSERGRDGVNSLIHVLVRVAGIVLVVFRLGHLCARVLLRFGCCS
jgi:hypothetical protein